MTTFLFFAAISSDGFLAGPDGDMAWAEKYLSADEDYGFTALMSRSRAMLMGARTFDFELDALGNEPRVLPTYVLTNNPMRYDGVNDSEVTFLAGDIEQVVDKIRSEVSGQVFVVGGADVVRQLLAKNLLDHLTLFVCPDVLGSGTPLFSTSMDEALEAFTIEKTQAFGSGLVQYDYKN
jgi:dihydrofolate reductase